MPHRPSEMNVNELAKVIAHGFRARKVAPPPDGMILRLANLGKSWLVAVTGNRDIPVTGQVATLGGNIVTAWIDPSSLPADKAWRILGEEVQKLKTGTEAVALTSKPLRAAKLPAVAEIGPSPRESLDVSLAAVVETGYRMHGKEPPDPATVLSLAADLRVQIEERVMQARAPRRTAPKATAKRPR
jgi:hypothetical protein